ncbi:MAG: lytic murein transglycosylase [Methylobacteriaceae bacterium]|nr:lytic murein transglycosylase [Methylobacteriaceae bacterium]MBV9702112.1 lytic murein transglycosylase [Methylobacteriaceae bacterium]
MIRIASWTGALVLTICAASILPARADFRSCLASLRSDALGKGISAATFDTATSGLEPDMDILKFEENQPEFKIPIWHYLAGLVDDERVADGKAKMRQWSQALATAEERFGVDRYAIAAVWGVESNFGEATGKRPLVQSLATLACFGQRAAYFRGEFFATLKIIERGDVPADRLVGSWAGAFGQTQFMPSTFLRMAVDLDGDGKRDVVDSVPDALGSTANYLHKSGWTAGVPWGFEVKLPADYGGPSGRTNKHPMSFWAQRGIRRIDGGGLGEGSAGLLLPAGAKGPAFLVTRNFDAIYAYNAAESYALAISTLSDRLRGGPGIATPWPTNDRGLSRAERKEVQTLLAQRGYDIGGAPDGNVGTKTREAILEYQSRVGLDRTGLAGGIVFDALRAGR